MQAHIRFERAVCALMLGVPLAVLGVSRSGAEQFPQLPQELGVIDDTGIGLKVNYENGISYMSGGAGSDEADALNRMSGQFNLKLTMTIPSGQFTTPAVVRIEDQHGKSLLEVRPNGPIFLAKLPGGEYVIQATAEGQTKTRKVTVPATGLEAIAFTWPAADEPARAGDAPEMQHRVPREAPAPSDMPR